MTLLLLDEGARLGAEAGDLSDRAIRHEVEVPVEPDEAFRLWTTEEGLGSWWIPRSRIRLEIGGPFELYFLPDAPIGRQGSEGCRFLSFVPGRMVSFTWNAPPDLERTRRLYTWVVVDFTPTDVGTRISVTHLGWPDTAWDREPQWAETFAYFDRAWGNVLALMRARLGARDAEIPT